MNNQKEIEIRNRLERLIQIQKKTGLEFKIDIGLMIEDMEELYNIIEKSIPISFIDDKINELKIFKNQYLYESSNLNYMACENAINTLEGLKSEYNGKIQFKK